MTATLLAYLALLGLWGWLARPRAADPERAFEEFALAGRAQSAGAVTLSLLATALGASTTLGLADMAARRGTVAAGWLLVGVPGLLAQARFFARPVREAKVHTLPELAGRFAGRGGQRAVAAVIVVAWIGVVAAQLSGLGMVLSALFPDAADGAARGWLLAAGLAVTVYAALGGQRAVIRTDGLQALWLFAALGLTLAWLFGGGVEGARAPRWTPLVPDDWSGWETARLAVLVGGAYLVGPDLFSRHASARDGQTARRAGRWAALGLAPAALAVTAVGLWASANGVGPEATGTSTFVYLLGGALPGWLTAFLAVGLIGALLSSADTCLVGVATMVEVDWLGRKRAGWTRLWVLLTGLAALAVAMGGGDILGLLLRAYSIYVPGVAAPVAVALAGAGRGRTVNPRLWLAAALTGGVLGLGGEVLGGTGLLPDPWARPGLALAGVALSVALSLASLRARPGRLSEHGTCLGIKE